MRFEIARPKLSDAEQVWKWRQDPDVLKQSLTFTKPISLEIFYPLYLETHFTIRALPPLFVVENDQRIALVRFDRAPGVEVVEISIVVDKAFRGKGWGAKIISEATDWIRDQHYSAVLAKIKSDNIASVKAFEKAGYRSASITTSTDDEILEYVHPLKAPSSSHVFVIAEAGSNWVEADPFELIDKAAEAGVDAIKFQIFRAETTYAKNAGSADYLNQDITDLFKKLEMPYEQIPKLFEHCQKVGIEFMATPFSLEDLKAIDPYVKRHKIASYENNHLRLLQAAAETGKPLLVSTGATNLKEIRATMNVLKLAGCEDITLLQCLAKYPAPTSEMNLEVIRGLKEQFQCPVGLSDHSLDPFAGPMAAVALGATVIEKHYTLDRALPGPDHSFAINPDELKQLVYQIRLIEQMRGSEYKTIEPSEKELRLFARRGLQALTEIQEGEVLAEGINVEALRPGKNVRGLSPLELPQVEGKKATRSYRAGEGIFSS